MNALEDRLREAFRADAETVGPDALPGLDLDRRRSMPAGRGRLVRSASRRVLIPLAAAATVAVVAVLASVLSPGTTADHHGGLVGSGAPPRFFLAVESGQTVTGPDQLAVYSAVTGRLIAPVRLPRSSTQAYVAAAVGSHTMFVVAVETRSSCGDTALYRLRLTSNGMPGSLTPLAAAKIRGNVTALAASSDGRTIAYATGFCTKNSASPGAIGIVRPGTGQVRQWTWTGAGQVVSSLSISADGRLIEYAASPNRETSPSSGQVLPVRVVSLLPANAQPGPLARRGRPVVNLSQLRPELFMSASIAADGRTVYFCTQQNPHRPARSGIVLRALDTATGRTSVLREFNWPGSYCMLGLSGRYLLIGYGESQNGHPGHLVRYDAATGQVMPVPAPRQWAEVPSNIPW